MPTLANVPTDLAPSQELLQARTASPGRPVSLVSGFPIATLAIFLWLITTSCGGSPEPKVIVRVVEVEVPVEKEVEKEIVREVAVPVERVVEVRVPAETRDEAVRVTELVKEVPVERVVEQEIVREVPVTGDTGSIGRELAQHTHEGQVYTLVEYGDEIAIFSPSGSPVFDFRLANDVLRSYAWGRTLDGLDTDSLKSAAAVVSRMDAGIAGAREASNELVGVLDGLKAVKTNVPLLGEVSVMDVIVEAYPVAAIASEALHLLDDELNLLGNSAGMLGGSVERIARANPSDVSGGEMEALFKRSVSASLRMEARVLAARNAAADIRGMAGALKEAMRQASDTPSVGEAIGEHAETVAHFETELYGLVDALQSYENILVDLAGRFQAPLDATDIAHQDYVGRWLQRPYDPSWRDGVGAQLQAAALQSRRQTPATASEQLPFKMEWSTSSSSVEGGESFTLRVRMYHVQEAGAHGGISVSFPSLTRAGGSNGGHSSSLGAVEGLDYSTGLSNVTFHQPGTTIYHGDNNRQFPAEHLLVESDDASWPRSADRTLVLRITPKRTGEFSIRIRGWLCAEGYTDCVHNPATGEETDQQGHGVEVVTVAVKADTK